MASKERLNQLLEVLGEKNRKPLSRKIPNNIAAVCESTLFQLFIAVHTNTETIFQRSVDNLVFKLRHKLVDLFDVIPRSDLFEQVLSWLEDDQAQQKTKNLCLKLLSILLQVNT